MKYEQAVSLAAGALGRGEEANWELARLTWEHTFTSRSDTQRQRADGRVSLGEWTADVGQASARKFGLETGRVYREIWERFGRDVHPDRPSWTEAYYAVVPRARPEATHERHAERHLSRASPERKRELLVRLLNDPALADVDVLDHLAGLLTDRRREVRGMPPIPKRRPLEEEEASKQGQGASPTLGLAMALLDGRAAARAFADVLRQSPPLDAVTRALVRDDLARTCQDWERLDALVEGGGVLSEIEAFLAASRAALEPTGE